MAETDVDVKTWFVTGASRGLGAAIAARALAQGERVALGLRNLGDAPAGMAGHGDRSLAVHCDLMCEKSLHTAIQDIAGWAQGIDVTVLNAGRGLHGAIEEVSDRELRELFDVNFFSTLSLVRFLLPLMRAQGSGKIFLVSSIASLTAGPGSGAYAASKAALDAAAQALRTEVAPLGIEVCLVRPGPFRTGFGGSSATRSLQRIQDYDDTSGRRIAAMRAGSGTEPGDPDRAATAIYDLAMQANLPGEVFLGGGAIDRARKRCAELLEVLEVCEALARGTDLPRSRSKDEAEINASSGAFR